MTDRSEQIKAGLIARLVAAPAVTALVPAGRIYPMQPPVSPSYPFIRYGIPSIQPYEDSCGEGSMVRVPISGFALGEDQAQSIAAAIVATLDRASGFYACDWVGTDIRPDGDEQDAWHALVRFEVTLTA